MTVRGRHLYPNLYTLLVGPPGMGKTTAIREARELLMRAGTVKLSPPMISKEKFIHTFSEIMQSDTWEKGILMHSSYAVFLDEFTVFLRPADNEFMTVLVDLYDCPNLFTYSTLNRKEDLRIDSSALNILGGVTPKTLANSFGPSAIGMGFTARLLMIYSEEQEKVDLFSVKKVPDTSDLVHDMVSISKLIGEFTIDKEAEEFAEEWNAAGCPPLPRDSRFAEYNPRRPIHWLKLGMLVSATRSASRVIRKEDLETAKELLLEAEQMMPLALEHFGLNPLASAIKSIHKTLLVDYRVKNRPILESAVRRMLMADIPVQYHDEAIDALVSGGWASVVGGTKPTRLFVPILREAE